VNLKPILGSAVIAAAAMMLQPAPSTAAVNRAVFVEETGWHS
jgi:hypothetical protein